MEEEPGCGGPDAGIDLVAECNRYHSAEHQLAVKSAFASVLFEPPAADSTPTADADITIIERVTAATCLVRTKVPASEAETTTDSSRVGDRRAVVIEHRYLIGWHLARLTLHGDSL